MKFFVPLEKVSYGVDDHPWDPSRPREDETAPRLLGTRENPLEDLSMLLEPSKEGDKD